MSSAGFPEEECPRCEYCRTVSSPSSPITARMNGKRLFSTGFENRRTVPEASL